MEKSKCFATGKTRFPTPGEAKQTMINIKSTERFYNKDGKRINRRVGKKGQCRYYRCEYCHGYHLTSIEVKKSIKKIRKDKLENSKNESTLVVRKEDVQDWKKDSIPFPQDKLKNNIQ